jgi:SAM-dependent methyltransferase
MIICNPVSRSNLKIPKKARVLDVGSGHSPHPRANVLTDKFTDNNYHRATDINVLKHQQFVEASGESLPFKDKEFDYVICSHVVEHVEEPAIFLDELARVGKRGYLEAPSLIGEHLIPKESHLWVLLLIDNQLVIVHKERLGIKPTHGLGEVFLEFLPRTSFGFKIMQATHQQFLTVNYEWKDSIDYIIDPSNDELLKYFNKPWDLKMYRNIFPNRSLAKEYLMAVDSSFDIFKSVIKSRILSKF